MKNYGDRGGCLITPSEISIILHMIRKPNSIIVFLFIKNNSQFKNVAKTSLPASMLSSSSIGLSSSANILQIADGALRVVSASCCFYYVFSHYFGQFQLQCLLLKRVKCPLFQFLQRKQLNLVPKSSRLTVHQPVEGCIFDVISSLNIKFL